MKVLLVAVLVAALTFAVVGETHAYAPSTKPFGNAQYLSLVQPQTTTRSTPSQVRHKKAKRPAPVPEFNAHGLY